MVEQTAIAPKITYLVANYNNGKYIHDCIASLHEQTSPDWHCLIVDDKSTDDSLQIIRALVSEKITLLENPHNIGYILTLEKLIDHASTDIVGILDPDDALYPEATELVLQAYHERPEVGFVYSKYDYYNEAFTTQIETGCPSLAIPPESTSLLDGYVSHLKTFRRTAYVKTAGLEPSLLYAEDRDLVYKMEEVTPFAFIDRALYRYRQVPTSPSNTPTKRQLAYQNHRRVYQNALRRRNIRGLKKLLHLGYFHECYSGHRVTPAALVPVGRRIKQALKYLSRE